MPVPRSFTAARTRAVAALTVLVAAAPLALAGCDGPAGAGGGRDDRRPGRPGPPAPDVSALLARMSVEDKVGQLFIPTVPGTEPGAAAGLVKKYRLGGVIYFPPNLRGPKQTAKLSNGLQRAALGLPVPVPLTVAIDQEQGIVARLPYGTKFPGNMAQAATGRPADVTDAAKVTGGELSALGINTDFAPVVDVNVNPANPVIGVRSFGSDPKLVAEMSGAAIDGFRAGGVAAVAKHFPGHGDTDTDSHTGLPVIKHSRKEWARVDAPPFEAAIRHKVDGIMSAHIVVPGLGGGNGPATLSKPVLTGLLRDELGFTGVAVTDALDMAGARQSYDPGDTAVRAVQAGADQLLMPPDLAAAHGAVLRAARDGKITAARLDQAVTRILRMKAGRGLLAGTPAASPGASPGATAGQGGTPGADGRRAGPYVDPDEAERSVGAATGKQVARRVAEHSITLVKRGDGALPAKGKRVFVTGSSAPALAAALRERGVDTVDSAGAADVVVACTLGAGAGAGRTVSALAGSGKPVVAVAVGSPYDLGYASRATAALATYSTAQPSLEALAGVLAGKVRPSGRLPVDIPKPGGGTAYRSGAGLRL